MIMVRQIGRKVGRAARRAGSGGWSRADSRLIRPRRRCYPHGALCSFQVGLRGKHALPVTWLASFPVDPPVATSLPTTAAVILRRRPSLVLASVSTHLLILHYQSPVTPRCCYRTSLRDGARLSRHPTPLTYCTCCPCKDPESERRYLPPSRPPLLLLAYTATTRSTTHTRLILKPLHPAPRTTSNTINPNNPPTSCLLAATHHHTHRQAPQTADVLRLLDRLSRICSDDQAATLVSRHDPRCQAPSPQPL